MPFSCLQFPPKNKRKQVDLRFHSIKVEFVSSFFGGNIFLKKSFWLFLTFRLALKRTQKCRILILFPLCSTILLVPHIKKLDTYFALLIFLDRKYHIKWTLKQTSLPSIPMKSPVHSVSTWDVPVAAGASVSSENESGISQGRYLVQQNPRKN